MAGNFDDRKVIVPGVAATDIIAQLHTATFLEDPKAANYVLTNNPSTRSG
jgi:nickel-dependent lactate racemase